MSPLVIASLVRLVHAPPPNGDGGLPREQVQAFSSLPADPHPEKLSASKHFYVSNERRPDLFRKAVMGRGGIFVGVGAEQNYLMAGWAQPEVLVLLDFDQEIVTLHAVYRALFLEHETVEGWLGGWADLGATGRAILKHTPADRKQGALATLHRAAPEVRKRLRALTKGARKLKVRSFLDDASQYALIRRLFQNQRVFAVRGDLTGPSTMKALADAAKQARLAVRVLYLSNAEQYFMYSPEYRRNVRDLPFDKRSVVLRTLPGRPRGFHYMTQSLADFHRWLKDRRTNSVYVIVGFKRGDEPLIGESFKALKGGPPPRVKPAP